MAQMAELLSDLRSRLHDTDSSNYRYTDQDLLNVLLDAMRRVRFARGDLFLGTDLLVPTTASPADTFPAEDSVIPHVVELAFGVVASRDDAMVADGSAESARRHASASLGRVDL